MSEQSLYFLALRQAVSRRVQMSLSSCRRRSKAGGLFRVGMGKGSGHKSAIDCGCWPRWEAWSCWRVVWRVGQNGSYSVSCARVRLYPVLSHILSCLLGTYGSVEPLGALWNDLSEEILSYLFIFARNIAVGTPPGAPRPARAARTHHTLTRDEKIGRLAAIGRGTCQKRKGTQGEFKVTMVCGIYT